MDVIDAELGEDLDGLYEDLREAEDRDEDQRAEEIRKRIRKALQRVSKRFGGTVAGWFVRLAFDFGYGLGGFVAAGLEVMTDNSMIRGTEMAIGNLCGGLDPDTLTHPPAWGKRYRANLLVACLHEGPSNHSIDLNVEFLRPDGSVFTTLSGSGTGLFFLRAVDVFTWTRIADAQFRVGDGFAVSPDPPCAEDQTFSMIPSEPEICFSVECLRAGPGDPRSAVMYIAYVKVRTSCTEEGAGVVPGPDVEPGKSADELLAELLAFLDVMTEHTRSEVERIKELEESDDPEDRAEAERLREDLGELVSEVMEPLADGE